MDTKIIKLFETLNIPMSKWPEYKNPYDFAKKIDKCALTINIHTTTSNSSLSYTSTNNTLSR